MQEFEQQSRTICLRDENLEIALRFDASSGEGGLFPLDGAVGVQGDEELGQPVADYFTEQLSS